MNDEHMGNGLSRRELLKGVIGTGGALLLPMLAGAAGADTTAPAAQPMPVWTAIGPAAQFILNTPTRVALQTGDILWVTRTDLKTLLAVSAKCTHHGCEVGWAAADDQFECPCHGAAFGTDGHNVHGTRRHPDEKLGALPLVPVRQSQDQVQVYVLPTPDPTLIPLS